MSADQLPQRVPGATLNEYAELVELLRDLKDGAPEYPRGVKLDERSAHRWHSCDGDRECEVCGGGLLVCTTCGGFEGSLTTVCPGVALDVEQLDAVYAQKIDFGRNFAWWIPATWAR